MIATADLYDLGEYTLAGGERIHVYARVAVELSVRGTIPPAARGQVLDDVVPVATERLRAELGRGLFCPGVWVDVPPGEGEEPESPE